MSNVQSVITKYTAELEAAIRADALTLITARFGDIAGSRRAVVLPVPEGVKKAIKKSSKGVKRTPEQLERTTSDVRRVIYASKGVSAEQIQTALKVGLSDIALPITKLLAAKVIRKTGQRRGTRYFAKA